MESTDTSAEQHAPTGIEPVQDTAALHRFEVFLFTAVATVLVVRAYLAATGYPQVGGKELHIAHVLWGGLLLGIAVVTSIIGQGTRVHTRAAFIGGIGFGLFIDEIGKFLTKDVNYFFTPAIAIMYVVFVLFYLTVRIILGRRRLTDRRRIALAAGAVADQILGQLDARGRARALALLAPVQVEADVAASLRDALQEQPTHRPGIEDRISRLRDRVARASGAALEHRWVRGVLLVLITVVIIVQLLAAILIAAVSVTVELDLTGIDLIILIINSATSLLVAAGLIALALHRTKSGYRLIQLGLVVDLLIRQVLSFGQEQFGALTSFFVELLLLVAVRWWARKEDALIG
ncbi:hypothetical protein GIS00_03680 [Nakamurella sp. YIM 132087]|uniref:Uncharacterized protein n=1 Tax=Nakamurella alba TaxID=2665158 RepID=A0A7K1FG46_9ACTN|nr:hypothetical protein [Nakamurella alba]MTD13046.1 hypothetical protein [Nakamurella alba]